MNKEITNNVFVTGATGLLGSHLLYHLAATNHQILALRRPNSDLQSVQSIFRQYPQGEVMWDKIIWVEGDVLKPEELMNYIAHSSCIYHCAAVVSFVASERDVLLETNLQGSENIAALCLEYRKRLCYVSSIAALGDANHPGDFIDEQTPEIEGREHSLYSQSKGESEKRVWKYIGQGLDAVIVCPSVILGAGHWNRSSARLYLTAAKGLPFYTCGVTGYVDVRDVVALMVRLAEDRTVKGQRFVLNGGNHSFRELFALIARVNEKTPPPCNLRPWMSEIVWRLLAFVGMITRTQPAFTREAARTAQRSSYYSSARILTLYPDFRFHSLAETVEHIRTIHKTEMNEVI